MTRAEAIKILDRPEYYTAEQIKKAGKILIETNNNSTPQRSSYDPYDDSWDWGE